MSHALNHVDVFLRLQSWLTKLGYQLTKLGYPLTKFTYSSCHMYMTTALCFLYQVSLVDEGVEREGGEVRGREEGGERRGRGE